jgi:hypothetical protein
MEPLDPKYIQELDAIAELIQNSPALEQYLDDEEDSSYRAMALEFEPQIEALYQGVADNHPMQIMDLEDRLLDDRLETLYAPRLLGFNVLRAVVDDNYRYIQPQPSFQKVLLYICTSPNFDIVKNRIGQGVQIGFALSSDIWVTNIIQSVKLQRVSSFLNEQRQRRYRDLEERKAGYQNYKRQFDNLNFYTAKFPSNATELKLFYPKLKKFIVELILREKDNSSLESYIVDFVRNDDLPGSLEYIYMFGLFINYLEVSSKSQAVLKKRLNIERSDVEGFNNNYFIFLRDLLDSRLPVTPDCDRRVSDLLDKSIEDDLTMYYDMTDVIHSKGYTHEDTQKAVREFFYAHDGLSTINECLRLVILKYFRSVVSDLGPDDFREFMEIFPVFVTYINIFQNEKFSQAVKHFTMDYARAFNKVYTDKRGRDYQDFKKFIVRMFTELNFMSEKDLKNFFKTKRKKKSKTTE